jgi:hypothetical protein
MRRILMKFLVASLLVFLCSCNSGQQWQHSTRTKFDFAIDDRECQHLALARAREESLVEQPILAAYFVAHTNCLHSRGWRPLETVDYAPVPVRLNPADNHLGFTAPGLNLVLEGRYAILKEQAADFLVESDGTYTYLLFQLDYPQKLVRTPPVLNPQAVFFDSYQRKDLSAAFYYQEAGGQLVFAATAYLYLNDNSRIVLSLSKTFFDMPADFLALPPEDFARLTDCQQRWQNLLDDLSQQL